MAATKTINLRDIPAQLANKAKAAASLKGMTLKGFVLQAIKDAIENGKEK